MCRPGAAYEAGNRSCGRRESDSWRLLDGFRVRLDVETTARGTRSACHRVVLPAAAFGAGYAGQGIGWLREAVIGPWRAVANPDVRNLAFYRKGLGIDAPGRNLLWMGLWSILWVVLIAVPLHFFRRVPGLLRLRPDPGPWAFLATLPLALMAISLPTDSWRSGCSCPCWLCSCSPPSRVGAGGTRATVTPIGSLRSLAFCTRSFSWRKWASGHNCIGTASRWPDPRCCAASHG